MPQENSTVEESLKRLDELIEPYFAKYHRTKCYPGLIFQQGKRQMVQINVPAEDLPTLLQAKPSLNNDPDSGKNRPEVEGHAQEIKDYIVSRAKKDKPWIVGTLTANIEPNKIEILELGRGFCLVVIPRGVKLDITDGQHRKRAIHELIESPDGELVADNDFPITLVLEGNFNQCQTDFRDMAQAKQLDRSLLLSFGEFEGKVGITKNLVDRVPMFKGKTEKIRNTASTKKKMIYTNNFIIKMVCCAFKNDPNDELEEYDVEEYSEALEKCLNQFFSECNQTRYIFENRVEDLTIEDIGNFKENYLLGNSVGLEILGRLLYHTYDEENNYFLAEKISEIANLDWSRESDLWQDNVVLVDPKPKNPAKPYKISYVSSAVRIAVNLAKSRLGWL